MGTTLFEKNHGGFYYDLWESESDSNREEIKLARLVEYIETSRAKVQWYTNRLHGFSSKAVHPLKDIPVMGSKDLRELLTPISKRLLAEKCTNYNVFQSGGTTGMPKTSLFSTEELENLDLPNARGFYALGLTPQDRVGNLFAVGGLYMTFLHIHQMLSRYGCVNFPLSNATAPEFIYTIIKYFNVNVLTGISSVLLNALRHIAQKELEDISINKVFYGGEHLYEADKAEIKKKFGTEIIAAPGYGTVDTWYIGYQCLKCKDQVFHAHDDQTWIEIVNEETEEHCLPNQAGMIYVTPFLRRLTPVIRYRVGDLAYWLDKKCTCGRTTPLFKLLGRGDDVLRIGYDSIDYASIQKLVAKIPELSGTIQMEKKRKEGKDLLIIKVETDAPLSIRSVLELNLLKALLEDRPSLKSFVEKGTTWLPEVQCLMLGTLPRNQRTGKLIRIMDAL
ncbi:MAG: hypothetical protein HY072_01745 [Deltaproteobacteria bacterium]|nr:hypothetical protein [Deltaproteobacteria bacterium]